MISKENNFFSKNVHSCRISLFNILENNYKGILPLELFSNILRNILRKTIKGYKDSISSLTFNTVTFKLNVPAINSSRHLLSKLIFNLSHTSVVKTHYSSKWLSPLYGKVTNIQQ